MTAQAIADFLSAHRSGTRKWQARCPAHHDSSPSLSIAEGKGGRVLIHCWAGCTLSDVLRTVGLQVSDLFEGPPLTHEQARQAALAQAERDKHGRERRIAHGRACDVVHRLERTAQELGGRLARMPDGSKAESLERLFHACLDKLHEAEDAEWTLRSLRS
jgi:hypothetical protein